MSGVEGRVMAEFAERLAAKRAKPQKGVSVTRRVSQVKQPRGGYVNPRLMDVRRLGAGLDALGPSESVHPSLVGLAVDYLTRFAEGSPAADAFAISMRGAALCDAANGVVGVAEAEARELLGRIRGLDDASVEAALKLVGNDAAFRQGVEHRVPPASIAPDSGTIGNVREMVGRSASFFDAYGPAVLDGFTLEGGYTGLVTSGDGDFLTKDAVWDFKVSKHPVKKEHTLQLLMYWRMGLRSVHPEFSGVKRLEIYNPRRNEVSTIEIASIPAEVVEEVEREVIGYR